MKQCMLILEVLLVLAADRPAAAEPTFVPAVAPVPTLTPRRIIAPVAAPDAPVTPAAQSVPTVGRFIPPAAAAGGAGTPPLAVQPFPVPAVPDRRGFTLADLKAQFPASSDGHFQMELPAILNTSTDREVQVLLAGQTVETTGQVLPEMVGNADGRALRITRSQLLCCSTHARQCSVALKFSGKVPDFKEMAWVTLAGTISYQREGLLLVPVIDVTTIKEIAAPKNPVLP